jgi:tetratricopeptide (TPR) repeat protein
MRQIIRHVLSSSLIRSLWQLGADHPDVAQSLKNLAKLCQAQGKYSEAEPLYVRAVQILEQALGAEHPNTRAVRDNYASLLVAIEAQS